MYKSIFFACLIALNTACIAQSTDRDIMKILSDLQKASNETEKANRLLELAMAYVHKPGEEKTDLDTAILLATQAATFTNNSIHDKSIEAKADYTLSSAYREKGDTATGHSYINKSLDIYKTLPLSADAGEAYFEISRYYDWQSPGAADFVLSNLEIARKNFNKSQSLEQLGIVLKTLADWNSIKGNVGTALAELNEALIYYAAVKSKHIQDVYDLLGDNNCILGDYPKAVEYGLLAEKAAKEANDTGSVLSTIYVRLAQAYSVWEHGNSPQAINYFTKALTISSRINDKPNGLIIFRSLIYHYSLMGRAKEATELILRSGKDYPLTSFKDSLNVMPFYLSAFTKAFLLNQAKTYAECIIKLLSRKVPGYQINSMPSYVNLVDYFLAAHKYKEAEHYAILAVQYGNHHDQIHLRTVAYLRMSRVDSAQGRFQSALEHFKLHKAVYDSEFNQNKAFQFAQMQAAFNTKQKEDSLKIERQNTHLLAEQNNADKARAALIRNLIIGVSVSLLFLLLIAYQFKQKSNGRLKSQQREINEKNESLTRIVQEKNQLLEEKEWLVKEIHHRVKNNLQIVTSLLSTQSQYLQNEEAIRAISESHHRMQAMSLLHQKLYQSDNATCVNMQTYIRDLTDYLRESFKSNNNIDFQIHIDPIELDITQAIPVGLILNEAITNSFKYAFTEHSAGILSIEMKRQQDKEILLLIKDNGKGLPSYFDRKNLTSMGMRLISGLSKQIGGQLDIVNNTGLEIKILFKQAAIIKLPAANILAGSQTADV